MNIADLVELWIDLFFWPLTSPQITSCADCCGIFPLKSDAAEEMRVFLLWGARAQLFVLVFMRVCSNCGETCLPFSSTVGVCPRVRLPESGTCPVLFFCEALQRLLMWIQIKPLPLAVPSLHSVRNRLKSAAFCTRGTFSYWIVEKIQNINLDMPIKSVKYLFLIGHLDFKRPTFSVPRAATRVWSSINTPDVTVGDLTLVLSSPGS